MTETLTWILILGLIAGYVLTDNAYLLLVCGLVILYGIFLALAE